MKVSSQRWRDWIDQPACYRPAEVFKQQIIDWGHRAVEIKFGQTRIGALLGEQEQWKQFVYTTPQITPEHGLMEAVFELWQEQDDLVLIRLGPRELENYLRDENHQPVLDIKDPLLRQTLQIAWKFLQAKSRIKSQKSRNPLVCHCLGFDYFHLEQMILSQGPKSIEELIEWTYVGSRCRSCLEASVGGARDWTVKWLWYSTQAKRKNGFYQTREFLELQSDQISSLGAARVENVTTNNWPQAWSERLSWLQDWLNLVVRPWLHTDAGEVEIVQLENDILYLRFKGQCLTCEGLETETLPKIAEALCKAGLSDLKLKLLSV